VRQQLGRRGFDRRNHPRHRRRVGQRLAADGEKRRLPIASLLQALDAALPELAWTQAGCRMRKLNVAAALTGSIHLNKN
jgi:hypothetical protein